MDKLKKSVIALTLITLICKGVGFFKNIVLAYYFGTEKVVDAYIMTFSIGTIIFGWLNSFTGSFTPIYTNVRAVKGKSAAEKFANNLLNNLLVITSVFIILFFIMGKQIVSIAAPGFEGETFRLTLQFWKIYCFSAFFSVLYRLFQEYLNCNERYVMASTPDLLMSFICLLAIIISAHTSQDFLIWGYVLAIGVESVMLIVFSKYNGFKHQMVFEFNNNIKNVLILVFPIFFSDILTEINVFVDKMFASQLNTGSIAALDYAGTMNDFLYTTGTIAVITILYPKISQMWAEKKIDVFKKYVIKTINLMIIIYIPLILGVIVLGDMIIQFVFQRGAFGIQASRMTTSAFILYGLGLIAIALRFVFIKVFYSMQRTKIVLLASGISVCTNIILNSFLVKIMAHNGLALSTSLSAFVCLPIYFLFLCKIIKGMELKDTFKVLLKSILSAGIMFLSILFLKFIIVRNLGQSSFIVLIIILVLALIGGLIYIFIMKLLKVEEVDYYLRMLKNTIMRR